MNKQQQHFVNEMLRHGNKTKAYRTAYPDAKTDKAVESSVNRLLKNKKVKAAIDEPTNRMRAEAEADLKARMQGELLDFYECQKTLAQIVRGQYTTTRQVRVKDGFETIEVKPSVSNVLSALNQFFRLNNHYPQKKTAEDRKAEKAAAAREISEKWMREERPKLPAWPTDNPFRHPWGDIYPPEYKGPFFDPKDPNTREQFLAITEPYRLSKLNRDLTDSSGNPEKTQQNTTIKAVISNEVQRREKSPEPMQAASSERQDNTANSQEISPYSRNDEHFSAQKNTTPVPKQAGTHNNIQHPAPTLEETIATKYKHVSPKVKQMLLRDALRKEGWQTLNDAYNEVYNFYLMNQHSGGIKLLKWFEKARDSRNHPPHLRLPIEKETGWTFHPKYPNMMKKTRPLKW